MYLKRTWTVPKLFPNRFLFQFYKLFNILVDEIINQRIVYKEGFGKTCIPLIFKGIFMFQQIPVKGSSFALLKIFLYKFLEGNQKFSRNTDFSKSSKFISQKFIWCHKLIYWIFVKVKQFFYRIIEFPLNLILKWIPTLNENIFTLQGTPSTQEGSALSTLFQWSTRSLLKSLTGS